MAISKEASDLLDSLKKLTLEKYPYEDAKELMNNAHKAGVILDIIEVDLGPDDILGRIRPNYKNQRFESKCDLTYVPRHRNKTYQRASRPTQTMFYACIEQKPTSDYIYANQDSRVACAKEMYEWFRDGDLKSKKYQLVTYSRWKVTQKIRIVAVLFSKKHYDKHLFTKKLVDEFLDHIEKLPERKDSTIAILDFFAEQFSNPDANSEHSYLYLLSALFTEIVLNSGRHGILYPSVRADGMTHNVAITPEAADNALELYAAIEMSLYKYGKHWAIDNENGCGNFLPNQTSFQMQPAIGDDHIGMNRIFHELNYFQKLYYKWFIKKDFRNFFTID